MGSLHGFEIECDRELRRLSTARGMLGTVQVRQSAESPIEESAELLHLIADGEGTTSYALGRSNGRLVSWHADVGSFLIDGAAGQIDYRPDDATVEAGGAPWRWEHRLGSSALPLLAGERGGLPLHASAAAVDGEAIVICGVTGRGKSTLAATLVARGHEPIAEDGVVVEFDDVRPFVWPGLGGAMISADAASAIGIGEGEDRTDPRGRRFIETARTVNGPTPVAGVAVLLERGGDRVELVDPSPAKAHRELLAHVLSARRGRTAFAGSARLIEHVPVTLLVVPDSLDELAPAAEALQSLRRLR